MKTIVTIGSGQKSPSHITIPGAYISDKHGELVLFDNGRITYEDYSSNGTTVNGEEINHATRTVKRGDAIIFPGNIPLRWDLVPQIPQPDSSTFATRHIGRDSSNDIRYEEKQISRTHAMIRVKKNCQATLFDKSVNGTTLNGVPVQRWKEIPVSRKDKIVFAGMYELDWSQIPKPKVCRRAVVMGVSALCLVGLLAFIWWWQDKQNEGKDTQVITSSCGNPEEYEQYSVFVIKHIFAKVILNTETLYFGAEASQGPSLSKDNLVPFTSVGTAFGVKEGYFATNYHVADEMDKEAFKNLLVERYRPAFEAIFSYAKKNGIKITYLNIEPEVEKLHLVKDGQKIYYDEFRKYRDLPRGQYFEAQLFDPDKTHDLAIIKLVNRNDWALFSYLPTECFGGDEDIKPRADVTYVGYPANKIDNPREGYYDVNRYTSSGIINRVLDNGWEFMCDYQSAGGASGSPVYNSEGKLIGVNHASQKEVSGQESSNTAYAIKVSYLKKMVDQLP